MPKYIDEIGRTLIEDCENTTLNYNPEFIAQGEIIKGFLNPDIILIGAENKLLGEMLKEIYSKFILTKPRYCVLTPLEAEIVKISINGFITTKLSFANMISDVCDNCGADKTKVLNSVGSDSRIGNKYFKPGYSFGGPCFPRDTVALKQFVDKMKINSDLLTATTKYNKEHIIFQTEQLLRENPDKKVFEFTGICYKENSKIPIIEESAKLKIAANLARMGKRVIIKDEIQLINECKKEYGSLFKYKIINATKKFHNKKKEINMIYPYSHKNDYIKYKNEYNKAIQNTIEEGLFINGPIVKSVEEKLEKYVDTKNAITVSCGTNALLVALMALDVKPGDEIITTPLTWIATSEVICVLGAKPVFVDINRDTYNIDENKVKEAITEKTKGILAVSLYGQMCNIENLMKIAGKHDLWVVEDGAQSFGSKREDKLSCSLATISCTSFYPTKPIGGWGNGGACFTNDSDLAYKMRCIRNNGCLERHNHKFIGLNCVMNSLQGAVLNVKLDHINESLNNRIKIAEKYNEELNGIENIELPKIICDKHVFAQYVILLENKEKRNEFIEYMKDNGINLSVFYPKPLYKQECMTQYHRDCPVAEEICDRALSLTCYDGLTNEDQDRIILYINKWFKKNNLNINN